jgi:UDP-glucuronate decarboxylase
MSKILITGGAGFIAGALAAKLAENPSDMIVIIDNFETGDPRKIPQSPHNNILFVEGDVNNYLDLQPVFEEWDFDYVFHYAALVGVNRTLERPVQVLQDIDGIKHILNLSKDGSVKRVFYSSSSEVYGEPVQIPQNEHTTPLNSRLPYAIVKNVGEAFLKSYQKEYGLDYTIFRFFNTYGPQQSDDFVISKFIKAAQNGQDITLYGDGLQTRTFCFIDDNVEVCEKIFRENLHVNDVVNIGSDNEITIAELATTIVRLTNSDSKIIHLPPLEEGDMTRRQPDNEKMRAIIKRDLLPLDQGIQNILQSRKF